jgi:hypothetical protein
MATTPKYQLPAPDIPDVAHGPDQILALGQAVENLLSVGTVDMTAGTITVAQPTASNNPATKKYFDDRIVIGPAASAPAAGALPAGSVYFGT